MFLARWPGQDWRKEEALTEVVGRSRAYDAGREERRHHHWVVVGHLLMGCGRYDEECDVLKQKVYKRNPINGYNTF